MITNALAKSLILVVDDVSKNLQVVGSLLRKEGYRIVPATSGSQALERIRGETPDLILLDLMMPEMDGLEVCRRLKAEPASEAIPVVFLTASNEMEHLVNGFSAGAVDYVTKPFNAPELLARVRMHLELKHARQRLREMNDEKNEFMGVAAHDLRSPLNAIKGYAEMALEDPVLGTETAGLVRRIHEAAARMGEMVQNLLDANRIERGEMQLNVQRTELTALLVAAVDLQRPKATAKRQVIHLTHATAPVTALIDPVATMQVLENLTSNAVKYSPPGKNIFVRLTCAPGAVRCEVQDEGPGLGVEDQKRLFGKFARLSAKPTGGEHSTGLGLSIVKMMVEAMGGHVWCESELGQGARFIVELPAERKEPDGGFGLPESEDV